VTDAGPKQFDAFVTPGSLLRAGREAQGISEREAADRLNFMPGYVAILERDDYQALRSPPFARGYIKAYGRMLGLDESRLLAAFDQLCEQQPANVKKKVESRPLQLQHTGLGVVIGLAVLGLLVLGLWWWQGDREKDRGPAVPASAEIQEQRLPGAATAGES
jgi:cytoskeleton protein RodZ